MKCKVRNGFVFHSTNEKGMPIVYKPGDIVEISSGKVPAQLELVIEDKKPKSK